MGKKLGFGCMRLPLVNPADRSSIDIGELSRMTDLFLERGFDYFDTATTYCDGHCEQAVRRALVERYPRDRFRLAGKLPTMLVDNPLQQEEIFAGQLARCGTDYFDRYIIHCATEAFFDRAVQMQSFDFAFRKRDRGLVREVGFSFHGSPELLETILAEYPDVDFVQLQINYADWDSATVASHDCYRIALKRGKSIVAMCSLKGGVLASVPARVEAMLRQLRPDYEPAAWALRFIADLESVDTVLSGMSSLGQMRHDTETLDRMPPLTEREREVLKTAARIIAEETPLQCTSCGYCTASCPAQIPIPDCLRSYNSGRHHAKASECTACGRCERTCPQRLGIIGAMRRMAACAAVATP